MKANLKLQEVPEIRGVRYNRESGMFDVIIRIPGESNPVFEKSYKEPIDAAMARRALELKFGWEIDQPGSAQEYIDMCENGEVPSQYYV